MNAFILEGLGFGNDENAWERCAVFATFKSAVAEAASIFNNTHLVTDEDDSNTTLIVEDDAAVMRIVKVALK